MCTLKEGHLRVFINLISFYYIPSGYTLHTSAQIHCVCMCCALWRQICFTGFDEAVIIMVFYGAVRRALLGSTCSSGLSRMRMYCKWLISRVWLEYFACWFRWRAVRTRTNANAVHAVGFWRCRCGTNRIGHIVYTRHALFLQMIILHNTSHAEHTHWAAPSQSKPFSLANISFNVFLLGRMFGCLVRALALLMCCVACMYRRDLVPDTWKHKTCMADWFSRTAN